MKLKTNNQIKKFFTIMKLIVLIKSLFSAIIFIGFLPFYDLNTPLITANTQHHSHSNDQDIHSITQVRRRKESQFNKKFKVCMITNFKVIKTMNS